MIWQHSQLFWHQSIQTRTKDSRAILNEELKHSFFQRDGHWGVTCSIYDPLAFNSIEF
jgi:hypothetical protein